MPKSITRLAQALFRRFHHLILYGFIGVLSSSLDFLVYTLLVRFLGIHYLLANCISVLFGITNSFILNRNYNFKVRDKTKRRFVIFLLVGLSGLALSNFLLYIFINRLQLNSLIAKLLSIVCVVFFQFVLNKFVTFKTSNTNEQ